MDLKVQISNFIKFMAYNIKYQQKAYIIIMCIKINVNILYHFLWSDLTILNSLYLPKTQSSLYFIISAI